MSGGWQIGDLAQCIRKVSWCPDGTDYRVDDIGSFSETFCKPVVGTIYTVRDIMVMSKEQHGGDEGDVLYLLCDGFLAYFDARLFIKITPPKADEFDREVIDLMLGKPVPVEA